MGMNWQALAESLIANAPPSSPRRSEEEEVRLLELDRLYRGVVSPRRFTTFRSELPERYRGCGFHNFTLATDRKIAKEQRAMLDKAAGFVANIEANAKVGMNLVICGSCGTGKDHLLASICKHAAFCGIDVALIRGPEVFSDRSWTGPAVLAISDPQPPTAAFPSDQRKLFDLVDARYSRCRSTFVTINAATRQEAEEIYGTPVIDRLTENALVLTCNWPSYRRKASA